MTKLASNFRENREIVLEWTSYRNPPGDQLEPFSSPTLTCDSSIVN